MPPPKSRTKRSRLLPEARQLVLPKGVVTTGFPSVEATCRQLGLEFDPWQRDLNRCILGKNKRGQYAADTVAMSIPRQVGKTWDIGALVFALCIIRPGTTVVWTAHRFKVARETFESLRALARSLKLMPHIDKDDIYSGAGNESIGFRNGSRIVFAARERGAVRGFTKVDILILDEAQILTDSALSDMAPTQNQAENPLIIMMGTPPRPQDPGEVFSRIRAEALRGESTDVLYVEFAALPDADPDDPKAVATANPSYPKRTPPKAIRRLRKLLSVDDFMREVLGIWDDDIQVGTGVDVLAWGGLVDRDISQPSRARLVLDVSPDRRWASIGMASEVGDGRILVMVRREAGMKWIVPRVQKMLERRDIAEVALHPGGQAGALIPELSAAGVEFETLATGDVGRACAWFQEAVKEGLLAHVGQPDLNAAVANARTRRSGEAELWDRRDPTIDISPVVACSVAAYRHAQVPKYNVLDSIY